MSRFILASTGYNKSLSVYSDILSRIFLLTASKLSKSVVCLRSPNTADYLCDPVDRDVKVPFSLAYISLLISTSTEFLTRVCASIAANLKLICDPERKINLLSDLTYTQCTFKFLFTITFHRVFFTTWLSLVVRTTGHLRTYTALTKLIMGNCNRLYLAWVHQCTKQGKNRMIEEELFQNN